MQGMSGSPVYIDGKLLGAVAMAFPFSKDAIAGIRPIEEMLRVNDTGSTAPPPPRVEYPEDTLCVAAAQAAISKR